MEPYSSIEQISDLKSGQGPKSITLADFNRRCNITIFFPSPVPPGRSNFLPLKKSSELGVQAIVWTIFITINAWKVDIKINFSKILETVFKVALIV